MASDKRNKRRKHRRPSLGSSPIKDITAEKTLIGGLLSQGKYKEALNRAKSVHKQISSADSEALLADTYVSRIEEMSLGSLVLEASSLLDIAVGKCPSARERLEILRPVLSARAGDFDALCRPLLSQDISAQSKKNIEDILRRELRDPQELACCSVLPAEHTLRVGALAVQKALEAVTSGPVEVSQITLPEISRRSPLAPWKMLVRAIACFYQGDISMCEQFLARIDPDSGPALLVPVIQTLLGILPSSSLNGSETAFVNRVRGNMDVVYDHLNKLDAQLESQRVSEHTIFKTIILTLNACARYTPLILDRLKHHIALRCALDDFEVGGLLRALGTPAEKGAYFFRLAAHANEMSGSLKRACLMWDEFRRNAIYEGWFEEKSPESAAVYMRIASLVIELEEAEEREEIHEELDQLFSPIFQFYENPKSKERKATLYPQGSIPDFSYFDSEKAFRLACQADPTPDNFQIWLKSGEQDKPDWKHVDMAAMAWRDACPDDSRPLIVLMESAEGRNALGKALGYLEAAEAIDNLNPEVGRARFRLLASTAIRHLKQKKSHLANNDLIQMEPLAQVYEGDRFAFLSAAQWACCALNKANEKAKKWRAETGRLMGSELAGDIVLRGIVQTCNLHVAIVPEIPSRGVKKGQIEETATAVARAANLGRDIGLVFRMDLPPKMLKSLSASLSKKVCPLKTQTIRDLAEAAIDSGENELAYAATGAGLRRGGTDMARFLFLRARVLLYLKDTRRRNCLRAAIELARGQRDMGLVDEVMNELRPPKRYGGFFSSFSYMADTEDLHKPVSRELVDKVIEREIEFDKYPERNPREYYYSDKDIFNTRPHRSPFSGSAFDPFGFDDYDEDEDEDEYDYAPDQRFDAFPPLDSNKDKKDVAPKKRSNEHPPPDVNEMGFFGDKFGDFLDDMDEEFPDSSEDCDDFVDSMMPDGCMSAEAIDFLGVLSPDLQDIMQEACDKYGDADGNVPALEKIRGLDPDLFQRIDECMKDLIGGKGQGGFPFADAPFPTPKPNKKKKRR